MKLRPDHSTCVVTTTRLDTLLAHVIHVLVLTENTFPLGTSGVRVVVKVDTKSSKSQWTISSLSSHLVCLGPMEALRGLMYDMLRVSRLGFPRLLAEGAQSEICRSAIEIRG